MEMASTTKYVTLISNDGMEFVVAHDAIQISPVCRKMLDPAGGFAEAGEGRATFGEMTGPVLEKVVEYMHYWLKYKDKENVPDMDIPVEMCLELLEAADFLGMDQQLESTRA